MTHPIRILMAEDRLADAELAQREIYHVLAQCEFALVETREGYLAALATFQPDLIISDYRMPRFDGLTALRLALEHAPQTPVIILTGAINEDTAVECMKAGAADYVIKEHIKRLGQAVNQALAQKRLRQERQQLEAQLRQSQKMESIGRLASGVAHDFNNMLTVIQGYCEGIQEQLASDDPIFDDIEQIRRTSERATKLTRQLLAFSRRQVLSPTRLDLNSLVADLQVMLVRLIGPAITLSTVLEPRLSTVIADPDQIAQVIMNLVVNARDAMPQGGSLIIRTQNVAVGQQIPAPTVQLPSGEYVLLVVADTGGGMDTETLSRIFEPFFTTKSPDKGTGLGLATVYGIIKQSGGEITVASTLGQGSTFMIYLPAAA